MKYQVVQFPRTRADILRNAEWWHGHHSKRQALKWAKAVDKQILSLEKFPERCSLAPENDAFDVEMRQLLVGTGSRKTYRAVFTIVEKQVHVLAVCRGAEDGLTPDDL